MHGHTCVNETGSHLSPRISVFCGHDPHWVFWGWSRVFQNVLDMRHDVFCWVDIAYAKTEIKTCLSCPGSMLWTLNYICGLILKINCKLLYTLTKPWWLEIELFHVISTIWIEDIKDVEVSFPHHYKMACRFICIQLILAFSAINYIFFSLKCTMTLVEIRKNSL